MEQPPAHEFDVDTQVRPLGDGLWRGEVSNRWSIGPYPNGGYVLAIALAAVRRELPHPDPFTVTAHYYRPPQHAPVDIAVERIRSGRAHSSAMARMSQGERWHSPLQANAGVGEAPQRARLSAQTDDERELVRVLANYGDHSQSHGPTVVQAEPPPMPPPDDCEPAPHGGPMPNGLVAAIRDRIEWRVAPGTVGWLRGQRTGHAVTGGWVRFADGRPADVDALPLIADCLPPPVFDVVDGGWVPTLELTVHVRARPVPGWLRCWFRTRFLVDGYLEEDGEVWDEDNRLVAQSRQLARLEPPPG